MTSSHRPITSKLSLSSSGTDGCALELGCALALFAVLMLHGAWIGLTDDEAYYWVLAQKPSLGYAFHPPMIAWVIALSQWIFGASSAAVVRLPAALSSAAVLGLSLRWLREVGVVRERILGCALVIVSLAGLFALSWMMVPDLPMFLGWMLMFRATWRICFDAETRGSEYAWLVFSSVLSLLSKYSAVLMMLSSFVAICLWAPRDRRWKTLGALAVGGILAAIPIVIWNSQHEWGSILYQIRDRHEGGSFSLVRWARFWAIEFFAAGPFLLIYGFKSITGKSRVERFTWIWAAPAVLVFGLQPLWSDFKPHWALVAWWPFMLALAYAYGMERDRWAVWQRAYGLALGALVLFICHVPVVNLIVSNPKLDVSNDLYGWSRLKAYLAQLPGNANLEVPVVGSRYQTASQAYFALGPQAKVTMLPRDLKARDEWPDLPVSDSPGPDWPKLTHPVLFVADNRYDAPPEFRGARCEILGRVEEYRGGKVGKWIQIWRCEPQA